MQYILFNGSVAGYRKCPDFHDSRERTTFWCNQDDVKYVELNHELAFMLGFTVHAEHGPECVLIKTSTQ